MIKSAAFSFFAVSLFNPLCPERSPITNPSEQQDKAQLPIEQAVKPCRVKTPRDQDLLLKQAHGIPAEVFSNAHRLLIK